MAKRRIKVDDLNPATCGKREGTLTIEGKLITFRAKNSRKTWTLPLATVVEMLIWKVASSDAEVDVKPPKRRRR